MVKAILTAALFLLANRASGVSYQNNNVQPVVFVGTGPAVSGLKYLMNPTMPVIVSASNLTLINGPLAPSQCLNTDASGLITTSGSACGSGGGGGGSGPWQLASGVISPVTSTNTVATGSDLTVGGNGFITGTASVGGDADITGNLNVGANSSIVGNEAVTGSFSAGNSSFTVDVNGFPTINANGPSLVLNDVSATYSAGVVTEVANALLDYGANFGQLSALYDPTFRGGYMRMDLRDGYTASQFMAIKDVEAGGGEDVLGSYGWDGTVGAGGSFGVSGQSIFIGASFEDQPSWFDQGNTSAAYGIDFGQTNFLQLGRLSWAPSSSETVTIPDIPGAADTMALLGQSQIFSGQDTFAAPVTITSTATVRGSAFSVGGSSFTVSGGSTTVGGLLHVGYTANTNSCALATSCTATCGAGTYRIGGPVCGEGVGVGMGGQTVTATSATCSALSATTVTVEVDCARIQ